MKNPQEPFRAFALVKSHKNKHKDAIERMVAILSVIESDNPRARLIQQVIALGEWALKDDNG